MNLAWLKIWMVYEVNLRSDISPWSKGSILDYGFGISHNHWEISRVLI